MAVDYALKPALVRAPGTLEHSPSLKAEVHRLPAEVRQKPRNPQFSPNPRQIGRFGGISPQFATLRGEPIPLAFAYFLLMVFAYSGGDLLDVRSQFNAHIK